MTVQISKVHSSFLSDISVPNELARQLRRADDFIRLGVCSGFETIQSFDKKNALLPETTGVILGTAFGPMETNFDVLDQVVTQSPVSPTLFSHSVFNSAAGYMATCLKVEGFALTITDFSFPFFQALRQGIMAIEDNMVDFCMILQVETYSNLIQDVRKKYSQNDIEWRAGSVCWLLERANNEEHESYIIENLTIDSHLNNQNPFLNYLDNVTINDNMYECHDPLTGNFHITEMMTNNSASIQDCTIANPYGSVQLRLTKG